MEVDISRGANYSANIISVPSGLGSVTNSSDLLSFLQNPAAASGAILGFVGGKQTTITGPNGQATTVSSLQGLIKAIQSYAKTNVLSTPQIIALDNTEANFSSAEKIPVPQQTAVQGAGVTTSVTKESIELSIKIKPQINKISNFVKLETEVKIGDIVANGNVPSVAGVPVFTTQDRTAKTTVVVGDSDTIVIGGLIRDKIDENVSKIPILGDIPVLGWLFKSKSTTVTKTNLLVFLTPHIVRQYEKVRALLDRKLKDRDDFIEKEAGGEDPERPARDEMIRNLPDIKDITAKKPNSSVTIDEDKPAAKEVSPDGNPFTGGDGAPSVPAGTNGAELKVPALPPSGNNTGAAEPAAPAPPAPGAQPPTPPQSGSGT
jgi:general secretion pathway protein D